MVTVSQAKTLTMRAKRGRKEAGCDTLAVRLLQSSGRAERKAQDPSGSSQMQWRVLQGQLGRLLWGSVLGALTGRPSWSQDSSGGGCSHSPPRAVTFWKLFLRASSYLLTLPVTPHSA